jgi:hypothetical protein
MTFNKDTQVRIMVGLHPQTWSLAPRLVFGIVVVLVVTLAPALVFQTAKAQVRFGIGVGGVGGGIGGILLDDSLRRQQYQQNQKATESNSTKKTVKTRNRNHEKDNTKIAKDSPPKAKSLSEPIASAPQTTPLTAGTPPTADNFGE